MWNIWEELAMGKQQNIYIYTYTHTHTHIYIYIYIYLFKGKNNVQERKNKHSIPLDSVVNSNYIAIVM